MTQGYQRFIENLAGQGRHQERCGEIGLGERLRGALVLRVGGGLIASIGIRMLFPVMTAGIKDRDLLRMNIGPSGKAMHRGRGKCHQQEQSDRLPERAHKKEWGTVE